ncbi:MAG: deoxyhypusine synthase family protein, partial [Desulfobacterota bacterium]|nr:deoxyhypusine synthase family protein [Thermodesulfobacteriota bacterium]
MDHGPLSSFMIRHFRHFNSAALLDAAKAYLLHLEQGGYMMVAMAGAMSTAEIGVSLAEGIRKGKVHGLCCTGANLEEEAFNLIAHHSYVRIPHYRSLSPQEELELLERGLNRVTDTCIPEEAIKRLESYLREEWFQADRRGERLFPHEFFYRLIRSGRLEPEYQIDPKESWLVAA